MSWPRRAIAGMTAALSAVVVAACGAAPSGSAAAQSAGRASDPLGYQGVYVASPALKRDRGLKPEVYAAPQIDGVYLRLMWESIEPRPGQYDWRTLDRETSRAVEAGKKISLAVRAGESAPAWLYGNDVERIEAVIAPHKGKGGKCRKASIPVPWDPDYQSAYARIMNALAAHLKETGAYGSVKIVKITGINSHSEETKLPLSPGERGRASVRAGQDAAEADEDSATDESGSTSSGKGSPCRPSDALAAWGAAGYRPGKVAGAWRGLAGSVNRAFPDKLLAIAILDKGGFPRIDESGRETPMGTPSELTTRIVADGVRMFPGRFAVQWNGMNAQEVGAGILRARDQGAILGLQSNLYGGPDDGAKCGGRGGGKGRTTKCTLEGYRAVLDKGLDSGARYLEVWSIDALEFPVAIDEAAKRLERPEQSRGMSGGTAR